MFQIPSIIILLQHLSIDFKTNFNQLNRTKKQGQFHMSQSDTNGLKRHKQLFKSVINRCKLQKNFIFQKKLLLYNLKHCLPAGLS